MIFDSSLLLFVSEVVHVSHSVLSIYISKHSSIIMKYIYISVNEEATEPRVQVVKLKSSLLKFYGRPHDMVNPYGIYVPQITKDLLRLS